MSIKNKILAGVSTVALLVAVISPNAFASSGTSGNGAFSTNFISHFSFMKKEISQWSQTYANTNIHSKAETGHNYNKFNTGQSHSGSGNTHNGSASSTVAVGVLGGSNTAALTNACCGGSGSTTILAGNGAFSRNTVFDTMINEFKMEQASKVLANTQVHSEANSGGNTAMFNTGTTVHQTTGNASSTVGVVVSGGDNTATVTGCGCEGGGSAATIVSGNGAFSDNLVVNTNVNTTEIDQSNQTVASTHVHSDASTGGNNASFNTGGSVTQSTGNANSAVVVSVSGGDNSLHVN